MRICVQRSTGKFCGACSTSHPKTLIEQAVLDYGIPEDDLEVREVTDNELRAILDAQPRPIAEPTLEEMNRADIDYIAIMTGVDLSV